MIAKLGSPANLLERSSSLLVVVVCTYAAFMPIQLSKDANTFLMIILAALDRTDYAAYSESMPTQHTFCCCRRSSLAYTEARPVR
jgi:hypothetical protein